MLKIFSWNVNGLRAVINKGALQKFLEEYKPDILCLQEIKAKPEQVDYKLPGYKVFWNPAKRAGYSGTAILVRNELLSSLFSADLNDQFSENSIAVPEGRILTLDLDKFYLVNVYVPNAKPDLSRLKLREKEWDPEFLKYLKELEKEKPVVVCGDFNAAHEEIDIARPKTNHHSAGFTDEERQGITNYINAGLIDTFRSLNPDSVRYTWWSHWGKARENNVGWRIDYFFVSKSLKPSLKSAEIYEKVMGSDHCPISIELEI
ncbi:exodeoxyribonuclease III [Candidatus Saccharibacteria bacterium]|nr:exodeoxyribonuclease III [Candidatus Saccharibacteria bacterium]